MEYQEFHHNIKVKFERIAPSYLTDSTYTDSTGYYNKELEAGVYTLIFTKPGYLDQQIPGIPIYQDTILIDQTLVTIGLYGELTGQISAGIYKVGGNIFVPFNETLIIEPGTILKFQQNVMFEVFGELRAEGTLDDSIRFTRYDEGINWKGIDFKENSSDLSVLEYCVIEYSNDRGISVFGCSPLITNSLIQYNSHTTNTDGQEEVFGGGAGICLKNSNTMVKNVVVSNNSGVTIGCGIYCSNGQPHISNSLITSNTNPMAWNDMRPGGGIQCSYDVDLIIENCVICYNINSIGGGICLAGFQEIFSPKVSVTNSVIYENSVQGEYSFGGGIATFNETELSVHHSTFWNNIGGNISCDDPWLGVNVTVNNNMDSCDAYENIRFDPLFTAPSDGDFSLASESPCIDAGNNDFVTSETDFVYNYRIWDGNFDNDSIVDMGAFEYSSQLFPLGIAINNSNHLTDVILYPNPSDKMINIVSDDFLNAEIFDLSGKKVLSFDRKSVDISSLPCSFYIVKIQERNTGFKTQKFIKR